MHYKIHIAIFLVYIFLGKSLLVDAKGLNLWSNQHSVSFFNPYCKKMNSPIKTKKTIEVSPSKISLTQVKTLLGFCNSQFQTDLFALPILTFSQQEIFTKYFSSRLLSLYLDDLSPPPRHI